MVKSLPSHELHWVAVDQSHNLSASSTSQDVDGEGKTTPATLSSFEEGQGKPVPGTEKGVLKWNQ